MTNYDGEPFSFPANWTLDAHPAESPYYSSKPTDNNHLSAPDNIKHNDLAAADIDNKHVSPSHQGD